MSDTNKNNEAPKDASTSNIGDALSNFRQEWKHELVQQKNRVKSSPARSNAVSKKEPTTDEQLARELFLKGSQMEDSGNMYEAIHFYKKAVQLVPDIEFRMYESMKAKKKQEIADDLLRSTMKLNLEPDDEESPESFENRIREEVADNKCICSQNYPSSSTHMSALPMEIMLYILRWVVSRDLDLRSLEKFGSTCKGYFICSRDQEIWRLACMRVWGINCGTLESNNYGSWRDMFIFRPRLKFHGCYISKTTYIRHGENSFQDQFYRPWHLVEYYRYLRFFPDGLVLMLTTADEPTQCVTYLKNRQPKNANILCGHYRQRDNLITVIIQKHEPNILKGIRPKKRRDSIQVENASYVFQLDLRIDSYKKKKFGQLTIVEYTVFTKHRNGTQTRTNLDLATTKYPPLWFSRVKSYTIESESPLQ